MRLSTRVADPDPGILVASRSDFGRIRIKNPFIVKKNTPNV